MGHCGRAGEVPIPKRVRFSDRAWEDSDRTVQRFGKLHSDGGRRTDQACLTLWTRHVRGIAEAVGPGDVLVLKLTSEQRGTNGKDLDGLLANSSVAAVK